MKQKFITFCLAGFIGLLSSGMVLAQEDTMKTLPAITVFATSNVSKAVTKAFDRDFKNAVNSQWYKLNKNFLVRFIENDLENKALYKKSGYMVYHIKYGSEKDLPEDVRNMVKSSYGDYNITRAINVHQEGRNIWVLNLEGLKKLVLARVENGELEEINSYQKSL